MTAVHDESEGLTVCEWPSQGYDHTQLLCYLQSFVLDISLQSHSYVFVSQVVKGQCKSNVSCSSTHALLANWLRSRQRMAMYIQASSMPSTMTTKSLVRPFVWPVGLLVARGNRCVGCLTMRNLEQLKCSLTRCHFLSFKRDLNLSVMCINY